MKEKQLFVGLKTPEEIKAMCKLSMSSFDNSFLEELINAVLTGLFTEDQKAPCLSAKNQHKFHNNECYVLVSGLYKLMLLAFKSNVKSKEALEEDLMELKVPESLIPFISIAVFGQRRQEVLEKISKMGPRLNELKSFKWRVDIGISNSSLSRELQATILMYMQTSNGTFTFEVPVKKFHELRYSVAMLLKEMDSMESSRLLKISN